ncbi:MAG: DUF983 domain-containing protein [Thermoanaerobaculia bacterium]
MSKVPPARSLNGAVAPLLRTRTARSPLTPAGIRIALLRGLRLRCPVCGGGRLFRSALTMNSECARCGVRFDREAGLWLGSMDINLTISLMLLLAPVVFLPDLGLRRELLIWGAGSVLVPLALFRFVRGFWIALIYLSGGVY